MLASFIWSSGSSPIRNAVGSVTLNSYMLPMFGQSWSVFAPNPIRSNTTFEIRATKSGKSKSRQSEPTQWYSISDRDLEQAITHHVLPSRLYLTNFQLISHYRGAFDKLNDAAQAAVGDSYQGTSWAGSLRDKFSAADEVNDATVNTYLANARAINALASAIARARWGPDVASVQVRTVNTPVAPYDNRLDDDYRAKSTYIMTGWRPITKAKNIDRSIIDRMYGTKADN